MGSKYYQNEERNETNPLVYGRKRENQRYQSYEGSNLGTDHLIFDGGGGGGVESPKKYRASNSNFKKISCKNKRTKLKISSKTFGW